MTTDNLSEATYALRLISYIKDDSAVAIHVNIKYDTREWTASKVHALRASVEAPPQRFRDMEPQRFRDMEPQRSTYEAEWARKAQRGSERLRDAILAMLARRR
jgi:hypothetical protein